MAKTDEEKRREFSKFLLESRLKLQQLERRAISQAEFGRRCGGIPQGTYALWENGYRLPSDSNTHKLAGYLGIKVYEILELPPMLPNDPILIPIINAWGDLPLKVRKRYANEIVEEAKKWREVTELPENPD